MFIVTFKGTLFFIVFCLSVVRYRSVRRQTGQTRLQSLPILQKVKSFLSWTFMLAEYGSQAINEQGPANFHLDYFSSFL